MNKPAFEDTLPVDAGQSNKPAFEDTLPVQQQSENYWGDTGKQLGKDVMELPGVPQTMFKVATGTPLQQTSLFQAGKQAYNTMRGTMPDALPNTISQMSQGKPFLQTPVGQTVQGVTNYAKDIGQGIYGAAKTAGKGLMFTPQIMGGTSPGQTMFGKQLREKPLQTIWDLAVVGGVAKNMFSPEAKPAMSPEQTLPDAGPSSEMQSPPNTLQVQGAKTLYDNLGVRGATVARMTPSGQNPGTYGTGLINQLSDDGIVQSTKIESYQKALMKANEIGKAVQQSYDAIKQANADSSKGTPYYDKLSGDSNSILRPILNEANDLLDKNSQVKKEIGATLKDSYANLATEANKNGGALTLDHIREELQNIGDQYSTSGSNDHIVDPVYSRIVELRNKMVNDVADAAQNKKLADNLRTFNQAYSTYSNLLPDMKRAAAMEITGQPTLGGLVGSIKDSMLKSPMAGKAAMKVGDYFNGGKIKNVRKIQ